MKLSKIFRISALSAAMILASSNASSAADVNVVFVVDESGSMSGEHGFLQTFVPQLESDLTSLASLSSSFGLVGYGRSNPAPHQFKVGGNPFGTAAEFATAAAALQTSGGTEDGWEAMDFALDTFTFDPNAKVSFVLVTDEDRDNRDGSLTYANMLAALQAEGIALTGILSQTLRDGANAQTAIATDGTDTFIADGSGGFTTATGVTYVSASGSTKADYTDMALATNGCVADLNQLRAGGSTADSFSAAFLNCLATAIQQQDGGLSSVISNSPLARVVYVNRQIGIGVGFDYRNRLAIRRLAAREGGVAPNIALRFEDNGTALPQNTLSGGAAGVGGSGFDRSRVSFFVSGQAQVGDLDATTNNPGLDYDVQSLNLGVDYLFPNDVLLGLGLGRVQSETDLDASAGKTEASGYAVTVYGSYTPVGVNWDPYIDGTLSLVRMDNDIDRVAGATTYSGSPDSTQWTANVTAGFDREIRSDLIVSPYVSMTYSDVSVDSYTETGGAGAVTVGEMNEESLSGEVGLQLRKAIHQSSGKLEMIGEVGVIKEFNNDSTAISVTRGTTTTVQLDRLDSTYGRIGLGLAKTFNGDNTFEVGVSTVVAHEELDRYTLDARVRIPLD